VYDGNHKLDTYMARVRAKLLGLGLKAKRLGLRLNAKRLGLRLNA